MSTDEDDDQLCEKAQNGCEASFTLLFHRYYDALHAFAYRLCADAAGAEDIAQEAFIKAARHLSGFRREASFKSWLYRIALHATRDWQRGAVRRREAMETATKEAAFREPSHPYDFSPLHDALAGLREEYRHAVVLVFYEGMNHGEAAKVLGCAETTVSWRVFRAKRQLRQVLKKAE